MPRAPEWGPIVTSSGQATTTIDPNDELGEPLRRTTQSRVADRLRVEVLSGALLPGSRLLQTNVAQRMNTSTTPVREAMRELAAEGLLDVDPHRGVIVHEPSKAELWEIYEIRMILEPACITRTVENISDGEIKQAASMMELMEAEQDPGIWTVHNNRFHAHLAQASRSPLLASFLMNLRNRSSLYVATSMRESPPRMQEANREHIDLVQACIDRDVEAAVALTRLHLSSTVDHGSSHLGSSQPDSVG